MNNFIDTHCHLDDEKFNEDLQDVMDRAKSAGVNRIINFGSTLNSSIKVTELANKYDNLFAGVGIHPEEIDDFLLDEVENKIVKLAENKKVVAIGEIGLDYHWEKDTERRELQQKFFIRQLDLARQLHLPICVHDREAHGDTLRILKSEAKGLRGVLHCFSGSLEIANEIWKMDWLIGIDGPLTFKNSAKLPEIVQAAPLDKILIETDSPYLAPTPYRGKRNEPAYVVEIAKKISDLRAESIDIIAESTTHNAENLYNLSAS